MATRREQLAMEEPPRLQRALMWAKSFEWESVSTSELSSPGGLVYTHLLSQNLPSAGSLLVLLAPDSAPEMSQLYKQFKKVSPMKSPKTYQELPSPTAQSTNREWALTPWHRGTYWVHMCMCMYMHITGHITHYTHTHTTHRKPEREQGITGLPCIQRLSQHMVPDNADMLRTPAAEG